MGLKTEINYAWKLRNDKRASQYAHVYRFGDAPRPWLAQKKKCFSRGFKTEREAGEFVAQQLGATLAAVTLPGWDESMRSITLSEAVHIEKPKRRKLKCRPRKLLVRIVKRPNIEEVIHSGRDMVSGCGESNSDGYDEM